MATRDPRNRPGTQERPGTQSALSSSPGLSDNAPGKHSQNRSHSAAGPSSTDAKSQLLRKAASTQEKPQKLPRGTPALASFTSDSLPPSVAPPDVATTDTAQRSPSRSYVPKGKRRPLHEETSSSAKARWAGGESAGGVPVEEQRLAVNAAFMWEVKSVNEDLWLVVELLQTLCRRPHLIPLRGKRLVGLLEQLLDLVAMQFTLEEAYGYFDDPEHVEAAFSAQAFDLRDEHVVLYQSLMNLVDRAQEYFFASDFSAMTYRLPASIAAFIEQFQAHDRRECELTLTAMNVDLGVGD